MISSIFPPDQKPTGNDIEPFMYHLQLLLDLLKVSQSPSKHHVTILSSVHTLKAREVSDWLQTAEIDINEFVSRLK